ncbi:autotransporter secretion outer membrane protein TamA [Desulfonatronum thiosulfatophilum]|uniref:Autotransporter secretion outer membrane protein TamA n=1 Tax=Desulfonatronum thiosulfatophilum TaxID=617002 RepID=A0A1G6D5G5_9BACT|nr:autotransporter assembly complex family protein [Desulfonatronum thiosulfatophilum]SDB40392.1 autotransporter secretion outer membrane protein TamA [Desulfonatronum thiosulfatophilum]
MIQALVRVGLLAFAGLVLMSGLALAQFDAFRDILPDPLQQSLFGSDAYRVEFRGELDNGLTEVLQFVSETYALRERLPATPEMLERRARSDIQNLQRGLRSEGYYDAQVEVQVNYDESPPRVVFLVRPGPAYTLQAVHFDGPLPELEADLPPLDAETVNLNLNSRARAPEIEQGVSELRGYFREHGHPFPQVALKEALVDHELRTITVTYSFNPGPMVRFGPIIVQGLERVHLDYIMNKAPWSEDQLYQASLLNRIRSDLMPTGLFTMVDVSHADTPQRGPDGEKTLPITITVVERVPRTVKAGVSYETDTGLGATLEWEHRNIFGQGERLRTRLDLAEKREMLTADFTFPDFMEKSQLEFMANIGREKTEALESKLIALGVKMSRQLDEFWYTSLGANYLLTETTQLGTTQTYGLFSTPGELTWDRRNDILNPSSGWRVQLRAEPFIDTLDMSTMFFKLFSGLSAYLPLMAEERLVLAARGALGSIMGEGNLSLPPNQRFYAGGGGSIRGYAYQSIGPELDGTIIGGRSMVETSMELRLRLKNNFGLVAFLDGGQVFSESELRFNEDFMWGAGLGARYYTDFAPIRLDVGFPLNRRDRDDAFQVYVSIGQAF